MIVLVSGTSGEHPPKAGPDAARATDSTSDAWSGEVFARKYCGWQAGTRKKAKPVHQR
ncbi:hypothetical protein [Kocuria rhizosphaericola]|uniref:hypothetical protein n=1 Tax=Kocuria rhizosphaericola TaxID=3376284 RepID=UPI003790E099